MNKLNLKNIVSAEKGLNNLRKWGVNFFLAWFIFFFLEASSCKEDFFPRNEESTKFTPQESFQKMIPSLMKKWAIPGGAVALVKDERLVMAEGYGMVDIKEKKPVSPESLFRIASLSKPITAVAVLKLHEAGMINIDERVFEILNDLVPGEGVEIDSRIYEIRVRDLLQHSGGWDSTISIDPMFMSRELAEKMGIQAPASPQAIIRYMLSRPLDFVSGSHYAYSNFGYWLLGHIIEKVTNKTYEHSVKTQILEPMVISRMRLGKTLLDEAGEDEVRYYDYPGAPLGQSVFPEVQELGPSPYGGFYLEAMDSHGVGCFCRRPHAFFDRCRWASFEA